MAGRRRARCGAALAFLLCPALAAQERAGDRPQRPLDIPLWKTVSGEDRIQDLNEELLMGGLYYTRGGLEIRADSGVLVLDQQEYSAQLGGAKSGSGLPRRTSMLPGSRRALSEEVLRQRLASMLRAAGKGESSIPEGGEGYLELFRALYLEGDVSVIQDGTEVVRASSVYLSTVDDRAVFHDVTLRLISLDRDRVEQAIVVRAHKLVRQGRRITGRNVSVTTCAAGEPHYALFSGEVEIIERENEFEIRSKDNVLAFSGTKILPIPNVTYFTSDQNPFIVKGASGGYSDREGAEAAIVLGSTYNDLGGGIHHFLTGRPAEEFRGEWQLGLGYVSRRGFPIDAEVDYRGGDLYFGRTWGFYLNDQGQNIGDIRNELDGTPITNKDRQLLRTENRVQIDDATRLDIQAFDARDPAVYSEFFRVEYYGDERPETDLYLRHSRNNYIGTAEGRWNLADFSYADGRELEATFTEKLPLVTFELFSQPLLEFGDGTPLLLTTETDVGQFRSKYDSTVVNPVPQETTRLDQEVDLAAPFQLGPFSLRPFISARYTYYEETVAGGSQDRWAFTGGAQLATRISRTWKWTEGDSSYGIQHELVPRITYSQTWGKNLDPTDYFQFDPIDAIQPFTVIRVGLLQRLLDSFSTEGSAEIDDFLWLDLGQNFRPVSSENNGSHLGLFDFEFFFWPERFWLPLTDWKFLVEGQYDWESTEFRTFNTYVQFPAVGVNWFGEYRTDQTEDGKGQVGYGAQAQIRGRWSLLGQSLYDLMQDQNISYDVRLMREDHDWRFTIGVRYDNVTDSVSLTADFEPNFGRLFRPGFRRYTSAPVYGGGDYVRWR